MQCTGNNGAQVALKWGHPDLDDSTFLQSKIFTTKCNQPGINSQAVTVTRSNSQVEIQTEGGQQTAYTVTIGVNGPTNGPNTIVLTHEGLQNYIIHDPRIALKRSSGPNKYGEQNFRVTLPGYPAGAAPAVYLTAVATGNKSAQMALTWGHTDFNDKKYFGTWTVKPGDGDAMNPAPHAAFLLANPKSEFQIQTEGGTDTGYHLYAYLDAPPGPGRMPAFEVFHEGAPMRSQGVEDVGFTWSSGNATGERTVRMNAPWLPGETTTPASKCNASGACLTIHYHFGLVYYSVNRPGPVTVEYRGDYRASQSAPASRLIDDQVSQPLTMGSTASGGADNNFTDPTKSGLKPGAWTITVAVTQNGTQSVSPPCNITLSAGVATDVFIEPQSACH